MQARTDVETQIGALIDNVERVIYGKRDVVELCVAGLLARGHILIEDVPGIGKTTLAHALAKSINCSFARVQFTSDLLPSDIIGVSVLDESSDRAPYFRTWFLRMRLTGRPRKPKAPFSRR